MCRVNEKSRHTKSLRRKILALLLISIVSVSMLIGGAGVVTLQKMIQEDSARILNLLCQQKATEMDQMLKEVSDAVSMDYSYVTHQLTEDASLWNDEEYMDGFVDKIHDELENTARNVRNTSAIYLYMNPDVVQVTTGVYMIRNDVGKMTDREPLDVREYDPEDTEHVFWYYEPVKNGHATWLDPYYNRNVDKVMISYVMPIYKGNVLLGVLGMDVDMSAMQEAVDELSAYDTGYAFLMSEDGDIEYHRDYVSGIEKKDFDEDLMRLGAFLEESEGQNGIFAYRWKGEEKRLVHQQLANEMHLVLCAPVREIEASRIRLIRECIVFFIVVLSVAIFVGIRITKRITKPLMELTMAANQVAQGNWDVTFDTDQKDEVGLLARTLRKTMEQVQSNMDRVQHMAETDTLTGLYNRHRMNQFGVEYMMEGQKNAGVLYVDLNGLKYANDHYGHSRGDQMLTDAAGQIRECFPDDMCCRMGGDEFVVCSVGRSREDFCYRAGKLRELMMVDGMESASIGWCWQAEVTDFEAMLSEAENLMYQDKEHFYECNPRYRR